MHKPLKKLFRKEDARRKGGEHDSDMEEEGSQALLKYGASRGSRGSSGGGKGDGGGGGRQSHLAESP